MTRMRINLERLKNNLMEVGAVANAGTAGYTRLAYSAEEKRALAWLQEKMSALKLTVNEDSLGNVTGRWGAAGVPAIVFGSHLDTVPNGGLYDGALGVIVGLECIQTLQEAGSLPEVPLELVGFVGEEANLLGGTFGSRAVAGSIEQSEDFDKKLRQLNFTWCDVAGAKRSKDDYHCYLELHIEQGALLETNQKRIGIVTAIAGILRLAVKVKGRASHSGTTPMHLRHDALLDAARLIQEVNRLAVAANSDIVATVGEIAISPNLANVVPGEADLNIEIRGSNWEEMKGIEEQIRNWSQANIAARIEVDVEKRPNALSPRIQANIEAACQQLGESYQYMFSGANHDANSLTAVTDVGMIFVPSKDGVSHHPDEFTSWEDIEAGANVMLETLHLLMKTYGQAQ
ncbi:Zn-dependent hydrolase [Brevibacillus sp. FSL K6-0770]|jgi:amidase, hydantoinase/carbamoylase family|uniref:Zn-dependent hydrolase n=1 Tax=Brevibacillus TaxID=55080 RepID=UPI00156BCD20|nr:MULTISPECIES: Zn-dependent hydrolase [Brevibacillus]NRQ52721.1 Zn-dependent hydrolase [Brevibacillus sp. HD1.4A]